MKKCKVNADISRKWHSVDVNYILPGQDVTQQMPGMFNPREIMKSTSVIGHQIRFNQICLFVDNTNKRKARKKKKKKKQQNPPKQTEINK